MLEKEIKFIYDFNINLIKQLGIYFTIEDLKRNDIHPAIFKYLSAEIDYQIFEDRRNLLKNSAFDYSGEKINEYFSYISDEIKKTKRFFHKDISDLLLQAISFNTNLLTHPKETLLKFIFDSSDVKSIPEIKQSLNYLYYYQYLKQIILSYFSQKKLISINKTEFEKLLNKIDTLGFETRLNEILTIAVTSMSDFFNIGVSPKDSIPLISIEQFLYEKHLTAHIKKLKEKFPGDNKLRYSSQKIQNVIKGIVTSQSEFNNNISASEIINEQRENRNYESEAQTTLDSFVEENDDALVELPADEVESKVEINELVEEEETSNLEIITIPENKEEPIIDDRITDKEIPGNEVDFIEKVVENAEEEKLTDQKIEIEDFVEETHDPFDTVETETTITITDFTENEDIEIQSLADNEEALELETTLETVNEENFEDKSEVELLGEDETVEIFDETAIERTSAEDKEVIKEDNIENNPDLELESPSDVVESGIPDENQINDEIAEVSYGQEVLSDKDKAADFSIVEAGTGTEDDSALNPEVEFYTEEDKTEISQIDKIDIDTEVFENYFDKTFFEIAGNFNELNVENLYNVLSAQSKPYNDSEFQSIVNQITPFDNDYMLEKINLVNKNTFNNNDELIDDINSNDDPVVEKIVDAETIPLQNENKPDIGPGNLAVEQIKEKEISNTESSSIKNVTEEEILSIEGEKFTELIISPRLEEIEIKTENNIWENVNEYEVEHISKLNDELAELVVTPDIEITVDKNIIGTKIPDNQKNILIKDFTMNEEAEETITVQHIDPKEEIPSNITVDESPAIDEEPETEYEDAVIEFTEENVVDEAVTETEETNIDENGKLTISQVKHHEDMPRIIEVVFDYDMIAFNDICNKISECSQENEALLLIDNYCKENRINLEGKETNLFKSLISRIYIPE